MGAARERRRVLCLQFLSAAEGWWSTQERNKGKAINEIKKSFIIIGNWELFLKAGVRVGRSTANDSIFSIELLASRRWRELIHSQSVVCFLDNGKTRCLFWNSRGIIIPFHGCSIIQCTAPQVRFAVTSDITYWLAVLGRLRLHFEASLPAMWKKRENKKDIEHFFHFVFRVDVRRVVFSPTDGRPGNSTKDILTKILQQTARIKMMVVRTTDCSAVKRRTSLRLWIIIENK